MNGATQPRSRQIVVGLGLAAICLSVAYAGGLLVPSDWRDPSQSRTLFPALMLIGAAIAGLFIASGASDRGPPPVATGGNLRAIGVWILAAAYAVALPRIGLIIPTAALCVFLPVVLGYRNWIAIPVFAVMIIALTWIVFVHLMDVPLSL